MDPFEPIHVDPPSESPPEPQGEDSRNGPLGDRDEAVRTRMDPADAALGIANTMLLLNVLDQRTDAAVAGAAEAAGTSAAAGDVITPVELIDDPLDDPGAYDTAAVADGSDGCAGGSFAILLMLTAAAGTAMALAR